MANLLTYKLDAQIFPGEEPGLYFGSIMADVLDGSITCNYGIRGAHPLDRVAGTGTLRFTLDNSTANSAALLGYYTPGHANCRATWTQGVRIRFGITYDGTTYYRFLGWLSSIAPTPGVNGSREVECVATDWMDQAALWKVAGVATMLATEANAVMDAVVAGVPIQPDGVGGEAAGTDTYPFALDPTRGRNVGSALAELQRIAQSEFGMIYVCMGAGHSGDVLTFRTRAARAVHVAQFTFDNDMETFNVERGTQSTVYNIVRALISPRVYDAQAVEVLFNLQTQPEMAPGDVLVLDCPYRDPNQTAAHVGGTSMVPPVETTDYLFDTVLGGGGTDLTTSLEVVADFGSDSAIVTLTNNHATDTGFVNLLQLRGVGLYTYDQVAAEANDATSIAAYGEHPLDLEMPFQADAMVARDVAEDILTNWKDPHATEVTMGFCAERSATLAEAAAVADIDTPIAVAEDMSAVDGNYWINEVTIHVGPGQIADVTWRLSLW